MGRVSISKKMKGNEKNRKHPLSGGAGQYEENRLTPVTLSGVIVPWDESESSSGEFEYKLVCASGLEYFVIANPYWRDILSWYRWEEVGIVGLLNIANMTIIPQRVFPKGPKGEKDNVLDIALWKGKQLAKKMASNVNGLIVLPAAVPCLS